MLKIKFITSIEEVGQKVWDQLAYQASPFCHYHFLHALETSGSVGQNTGWFPQHLVIYQQNEIVGILPLYKKTHSYGEYVFDFAWANTYRQYGLLYYPKLVSAIPFTPVTGPRLMLKADIERDQVLPLICEKIKAHLTQYAMSSMHWLFVDENMSQALTRQDQISRRSVQFQWFNRDYTSFSHYLDQLNSRRRKSIKKERAKVIEEGVQIKRLSGEQIQAEDMTFFFECYKQTYLKKSGHNGYLTQAFFDEIYRTLKTNIMLVLAYEKQQPIAGALFIYDKNQLCGRYWGSLTEVNKLHFECCYYQGIEFCIEKNIAQFNPGTQGEHKILRGFEPTYCYSNHSLREQAFHEGVERFVKQENTQLDNYKKNAEKLLPFKVQ